MRQTLAVIAVLVVTAHFSFALSEQDQAARDTALHWLAIVDAGQYEKAWQSMPPRIKAGGLEQQWVGHMRARRTPLGHAKSRQFVKVAHKSQLPGTPDGNYMQITFKTSFEHKTSALEGVTLTSETGQWKVSGYGLR